MRLERGFQEFTKEIDYTPCCLWHCLEFVEIMLLSSSGIMRFVKISGVHRKDCFLAKILLCSGIFVWFPCATVGLSSAFSVGRFPSLYNFSAWMFLCLVSLVTRMFT